ncbi:MAG: hypothetical protein IKF97_03820 [Clostridia bacterium]|nr:hypothetical protein [Clostridia bacterium]
MKNYNYQEQSLANVSCLLEDSEYNERKEGFLKAIQAFNQAGIHYAVACSFNLFLRGMVDDFHDFDIIVQLEDVPKLKNVMQNLGAELVLTGGNGYCESEAFMRYHLGRTDFDIISGFKVITFGTQYLYRYDKTEVEEIKIYEDDPISVPLITLEALYILYGMMEGWQPKRKFKRLLIQEVLEEEMNFIGIFNSALENQNLPGWLRRECRRLLAIHNS